VNDAEGSSNDLFLRHYPHRDWGKQGRDLVRIAGLFVEM
jgi:hypothetical protein